MTTARPGAEEFCGDFVISDNDTPAIGYDERLFHDVRVNVPGFPTTAHIVLSGKGRGHAYMYAVGNRLTGLHPFQGSFKIGEAIGSRLAQAFQNLEKPGYLLDGACHVWTCWMDDKFARKIAFHSSRDLLIKSWSEVLVSSLDVLSEYHGSVLPLLHESPQELSNVEQISRLDRMDDVDEITGLLDRVIAEANVLPEGLPADTPALEIIKRLANIDFEVSLDRIELLLQPNASLPFRVGYFQLSIAGFLLAKLAKEPAPVRLSQIIWSEIERLKPSELNQLNDRKLSLALLAAYLAIEIVVEESSQESLQRLDHAIKEVLDNVRSPNERTLFLRFLGDSLDKTITEENLSSHLTNLLIFLRQINDEPSLLRESNWFLRFLAKSFDPLRALIAA